MVYDTTFTLSGLTLAGVQTIYWYARPASVDTSYEIQRAEHRIPGALHSILQALGAASETISFSFDLYDVYLVTITPAGLTRPQEVLALLKYWARNGTVLTFKSDQITQMDGETSGVEVLLWDLTSTEEPTYDGRGTGTDRVASYVVDITLKRYYD